ncbi:nitrate ABC transporter, permease protein [Beggiatoa alba B18LD]|uniref:Nitrate ABC transporter, permease protein n=1 Tax=Beggiatoa alba B18LD TaxID=395493 RepID=I3CF86_9GAMM|nr:nitrate ABC transporter permease [Beggiatoa alba]EIJ42279.1 nitrate ABC transporter, permease protein [Beggiatoa alba B18LD]
MSNHAVVIPLPLNNAEKTTDSVKPIALPVTMTAETVSESAKTPELPKQASWLANNWQTYTAATLLPLVTFAIVIGLWLIVQKHFATDLPTPSDVWQRATEVFASPFYDNGPNDKGIGWQVMYSLGRVMAGFSLAVIIGIPLGFLMGMSMNFSRACTPLIQILRPVSPLAWLPIGLLMFKAVDPSAIFVIFITSIWPIIINTSAGVRAIPKDYMNVAAVLQLNTFEITRKILLPATLPHILTGMRLSLNIAWMVIVAAEMLTGGIGIGFYVWDEWNNLNVSSIVVAILLIGVVGIVLEMLMNLIQSRFDYNAR